MLASGSVSKNDLEEYRAGYPGKRDQPGDRNVQFYRNSLRLEPEGKLVEEVHRQWWGNYRLLESCHSYIQWLFPIREPGLNPAAQVLQRHEIATLRADRAALDRIVGSFRLMLDFYGFALDTSAPAAAPAVVPLLEHESQFRNLNASPHNYLRVTRILKCLGEMGMEDLKLAWLRALEREIYATGALPNCRASFESYWIMTVYSDAARAEFAARAKAQPARPPRG